MNCTKQIKFLLIAIILFICVYYLRTEPYFPLWAKFSKNVAPIQVLDTNSSLGRYSSYTKTLGLKDLALVHGHLCDGLVISFIELKEVLKKLFPSGIVDRTDLRVVSKNGPCWVDAAYMITGARINFGTLSLDKNVGNGFIVQKISTGETYQVKLKQGVFPDELALLETKIKADYKAGNKIPNKDIEELEKMANDFSKTILNSKPSEILEITKLKDYKFKQNIQVGSRTDVINKNN